MNAPIRILFVEDQYVDAELQLHHLAMHGVLAEPRRVDSRESLLRELGAFSPDLVISESSLPGLEGQEALSLVSTARPDLPFIFVTRNRGEDHAVDCLKQGATDYVLKGNLTRLGPAVDRAMGHARQYRSRLENQAALVNFKRALDTHAIVSITDPQGRITYANDQFCQVSKYSREELMGRDHRLINSGRHSKSFFKDMWETIQAGMVWKGDICNRAKDGSLYWVCSTIMPFLGPDGSITQYISVRAEITERYRQHERILRLSRIRSLIGGINKAIVRIHRLEDLFREFCRISVETGGFRSAVLLLLDESGTRLRLAGAAGEELGCFAGPGSGELLDKLMGEGLAGRVVRSGRPEAENELTRLDGPFIVCRDEALHMGFRSMAAVPLKLHHSVRGVFLLFSDAPGAFDAELLAACRELVADVAFGMASIERQERLQFLAHHDALTGLPNRARFVELLDKELSLEGSSAPQRAVAALNLVRFGRVNEGLSRATGDALLQEVARRLGAAFPFESHCARLGSDSFALILEGTEKAAEAAARMEAQVLSLFDEPFIVDGRELRLAARAGLAFFPEDGPDAETLLRNAESAVRQAKEDGQEFVFYSTDMNAQVAEILDTVSRLRRAIEERQFVLHYQPKVSLPDRRIEGVEALIRWNAPGQGLVPPVKFIPLLEENGLIQEVGLWALQQAAADYQGWIRRGLRAPRIAVNVSSLQLRRSDFVPSIFDAIQPGPGCGVDIEVTESMLMDDIEGSARKLKQLQEAGLRISIDDFGTGHSSLSYLARLPIDVLKVDRAFVTRMGEREDDHAIVAAIIALAHILKLKVVAEGVETEEQAKLLDQLGCDQMQGYLYSRPVPEEKLAAMLDPMD